MAGAAEQQSLFEKKSVSPDLRTGRVSLTCAGVWGGEDGNAEAAYYATQWGAKLYKHGTGVYYNEPGYEITNWKVRWKLLL